MGGRQEDASVLTRDRSKGELSAKIALEKQFFYAGDSVNFKVAVVNESNKTVKKISVALCTFGHVKASFEEIQYCSSLATSTIDEVIEKGERRTIEAVLEIPADYGKNSLKTTLFSRLFAVRPFNKPAPPPLVWLSAVAAPITTAIPPLVIPRPHAPTVQHSLLSCRICEPVLTLADRSNVRSKPAASLRAWQSRGPLLCWSSQQPQPRSSIKQNVHCTALHSSPSASSEESMTKLGRAATLHRMEFSASHVMPSSCTARRSQRTCSIEGRSSAWFFQHCVKMDLSFRGRLTGSCSLRPYQYAAGLTRERPRGREVERSRGREKR